MKPTLRRILIFSILTAVTAGLGQAIWFVFMEWKKQPEIFTLLVGLMFLAYGVVIGTLYREDKYLQPSEIPIDKPILSLDRLSPAEIEVLQLLIRGHSNAEIADARHISLNTVKTHIQRIYEKTGVNSRTKLIHLVNRTQ